MGQPKTYKSVSEWFNNRLIPERDSYEERAWKYLGLHKFPTADELDYDDLQRIDEIQEYVHRSGSATLSTAKNQAIRNVHAPLRVSGATASLDIIHNVHDEISLEITGIHPGDELYVSNTHGAIHADLPDIPGDAEIYLYADYITVNANTLEDGSLLYTSSSTPLSDIHLDEIEEGARIRTGAIEQILNILENREIERAEQMLDELPSYLEAQVRPAVVEAYRQARREQIAEEI